MNKRAFLPSKIEPSKAVTILVHGLNMKPTALLNIANVLTQNGSDVVLIRLTGHKNDPQNLAAITRQNWLSDLLEAYFYSKDLIKKDNPRPIYFIGFSLGALAHLDVLTHYPEIAHCDKMVLLAPANAPKWSTHLIKCFFIMNNKSGIPSLAPKKYRYQNKTPVQAYKVLFEMKKSIENEKYRHLNIPTMAVMDAKDETISLRYLKKIIKTYQLTNWQIYTLNSQYVGKHSRHHHLIIDEHSMGSENWNRFIQRIKTFFYI